MYVQAAGPHAEQNLKKDLQITGLTAWHLKKDTYVVHSSEGGSTRSQLKAQKEEGL